MLVDIFNSFEPVRFLIDSPLWVSFFAPGVGFILILGLVYSVLVLTLRDPEATAGLTIGTGILLIFVGGIWTLASLAEVFKQAGIAEGHPLALAVIAGTFSNFIVATVIIRAAFYVCWFIYTHPKFQKLVNGSGESSRK